MTLLTQVHCHCICKWGVEEGQHVEKVFLTFSFRVTDDLVSNYKVQLAYGTWAYEL